jgi:hypothetical protein
MKWAGSGDVLLQDEVVIGRNRACARDRVTLALIAAQTPREPVYTGLALPDSGANHAAVAARRGDDDGSLFERDAVFAA